MDHPNPVSAHLTLRRLVAAGVALALLFLLFPAVDIWAARLFFMPGAEFPLGRVAAIQFVHDRMVPALLIGGVLLALLLYGINRWRGTQLLNLNTRGLVFVLLCLALGPGLTVNLVLKDHWGRARPAQIEAFGGDRAFSPPLIPTDQCERNCSFVAGDPSAGFFYLSFAMLAGSVPGAIAAIGLGLALGAVRMAEGGHFLSDVLFSGLITVSLVRLLYLLLIEPDGPERGARWWRWAAGSIAGRLTLALVLLSIAIVACALALDRPVAIWAHALPPGVQLVMAWITRLGVSTGWLIATGVPVILFWLLRSRLPGAARQRWQSYAYVPLFAFSAIAGAGLANSVIKAVAGRFRPKLFFLDQHYGFDLWHRASDYTSFPSGHTAIIFAVATVVTLMWRRLAWPAFAVAALVGLSRVLVGAHWPSDVLAGAWLGVAWTLWVRHLFVTHGAAPAEALAGRAAWRGPLFRISLGRPRRKATTTPCATADR